jgi:hypothetical protein
LYIVKRGYQVGILDDLSTGKMENTASLINSTDSTIHKAQQDEFIQAVSPTSLCSKNSFKIRSYAVDYLTS